MKITLNTQELNQAVVEYLSNQGLSIDTNKVSILIDEEGVTVDTAANTHTYETKIRIPTKPKKEEKTKPTKVVTEHATEDTTETATEASVSSSIAEVEDAAAVVTKPDKRALAGFGELTDDVLEDDTPQTSKEDSVEKTRKLFS